MLRPSDILRCVGFLIAVASTAVCQTTNGTILGIVTDPSGAAVSAAVVQVVNESTGARREVTTSNDGLYQALALSAGAYSITVTVPGFQSTTYRGVELQVQQTARFNISLELQRQAEAVSVSARAPLLDSDSAAVGAVIDSARLIEMPLNGRDFNQLSLLSAGVVQFGSGGTAIGFAGQLGIGVSTNGTRFAQQNYQIDGMANYNERIYSTSINPSVDMIQEFKIQTSTYSAEYGLGGG